MAINSPENQSIDSKNWQTLKKAPLGYNESITSSASSKQQRKKIISPYLNDDKVKLHSRVTEKKVLQRKTTDFISSFPLAANIYKANSDEFKIAKRVLKKGKKCVHTLPNEPASQLVTCTVSDMNDSEYNETKISRKPKPKVKKRRTNKNNPDKNIEIYDRDAKYCSQFNINLDSSSSDMFQHLTGDGRKVLKKPKNVYGRNQIIDNEVWAVLRNINKMQFIPSPPMSGTSIESLKKSARRRTSDRNDASFIETCRTEEFAYISYDSNSLNSHSRSSSFDRVTVIGKQDDVTKTYTYTKRGICDKQHTHEEIGNQKKKRVSKNVSHNKTEPKNKVELQNFLNIKTDLSPLQKNNTIIHKDGKQCGNSENKTALICDSESIRPYVNTLIKADTEKVSVVSESENQEQLNGITRVLLSKGVDCQGTKNNSKQRESSKSQSGSPSANARRIQLTSAEMRRKLSSLKYPIVVTGKENLSPYILVKDYKPPQFFGLDKQIWPFMIKWLPESQKATVCLESNISPDLDEKDNVILRDKDLHKNRTICKMHNNERLKKSKNQTPSRLITEKEKPMRIFKDKMLNLMCSNKYSIVQNTKNDNTGKVKHNSVNIETQTHYIKTLVKKDKCASPVLDLDIPQSVKSKSKHPWSKAKWASDFIENVIRKVKCGVYYSQESKKVYNSVDADSKMTQTDNLLNDVKYDEVALKDDISDNICYNGVIPGFEDKIQDLELETVTKSQIAIKHCNTNVVVQFDIAFPADTNAILQKNDSILFLPIEITASGIYKYKATITNSILPAELCSIFPKMLSNIFDSNLNPLPPKPILDNIEFPNVFPIKELMQLECPNATNTLNNVSTFNLSNNSPSILLQKGRFTYASNNNPTKRPKMLTHDLSALGNLFPEIGGKALFETTLCLYEIPLKSTDYEPILQKLTTDDIHSDNCKENTCTAIVPYIPRERTFLDLKNTVELDIFKTNNYPCLNFSLGLLSPFKVERFGTKTVVSLYNNSDNKITYVLNKVGVELLYKHYGNNCNENSYFYDHTLDCHTFDSSVRFRDQNSLESCKSRHAIKKLSRRKSFVKLCKKCKSTSSIPHYKRNTPLQKIVNLDEFFQALGSAKNLAGAVDGETERKILLSVVEMKAWISEITPRQALMILLLANKKESCNIIRFRNVILQGIAMNRITKISELDMEIEVIERENLNNSVLSQGISYLPASAENQDSLLEELCWIAKTTASDYQKPFDKTSERLLKSLLGKRKKLNPSYLRVMARYVGLGLLNSK